MSHARTFSSVVVPLFVFALPLAACGGGHDSAPVAADASASAAPPSTATGDPGSPPVPDPGANASDPDMVPPAPPSVPNDAGTSVDDAAAVPACANLVNDAPPVVSERVSGGVPAPFGGTIQAGTYVLTSARFYDGSQATEMTFQRKLVVHEKAGDPTSFTWESINEAKATFAGIYGVKGTELDRTIGCPTSPTEALGFSASGRTLTFTYFASSMTYTYTRQ